MRVLYRQNLTALTLVVFALRIIINFAAILV